MTESRAAISSGYFLAAAISIGASVAAGEGAGISGEAVVDRGFDFHLTDAEMAEHPVRNADFEMVGEGSEVPGWEVVGEGLVRLTTEGIGGSGAARIERKGEAVGRLVQDLDVSAFEGEKVFLHARAKVEGGVVPYFRIDSLDGEKGRLTTGGGFQPTTVLGEFHRFGYWYDFRYGWPVNHHMPVLYQDGWQDVGAIFTIPAGVRRVRLTFEARGAKYGLIERRETLPRLGAVVLDAVRVGRAHDPGADADAGPWSELTLDPEAFFYLSYLHNQQLIRVAGTEQELWRVVTLLGYAKQRGLETGRYANRVAQAAARVDDAYARLAGLRRFYEANATDMLAAVDLSEVRREYPLADAAGFGASDSAASSQLHLSVWIESLVRGGFTFEPPLVEALRAAVDRAEASTQTLADELADALGAGPASADAPPPAAADAPLLPADGRAPRILFSTGNTNFPYRVYKDLGVDIVSINYYNNFTEQGIDEHRSVARILRELDLAQISSLFSPVHYQFAVTNGFMEDNADRLDEVLRYDASGLSPFVTRHRETSRKKNTRVALEGFTPDPALRYYVPINPLSPRGRALMGERTEAIRAHAAQPDNAGVLAALELSAEAVPLVSPAADPWTRAAFAAFLREKFRSIAAMNATLETSFGSFEDAAAANPSDHPPAERVRLERLERAFALITDARIYREVREELARTHPDLPVLHRNNDMFFSDFAYDRASLKDDYLDYHAGYDRAYGYYLGRAVDKDHIIGEDNLAGPTGLRERETVPIVQAKLLRTTWRFASWGTKSICLWRMYREPLFVSAASNASHYTLINENYALLPHLKALTRRFAAELDGEVHPPATTILQLRQQGHVSWYLPSVYNVAQFLRQHHVDYAYSFEAEIDKGEDSLDKYRLIVVPPSLFVDEPMQRALAAWVERGGVLVTFGPLGLHDEYARPSGLFLRRVFGPGSYHLIGSAQRLRAYEGYWLPRFEGQGRQARAIPIQGDVPWEGDGRLLEKRYNDPRLLGTFEPEPGELEPGHYLYASDYGAGRVIYVPREFLPNSAAPELWRLIDEATEGPATVSVDEADFSVMLRRPRGAGDAAGWHLFVQHENEWAGPCEATVSVRGRYGAVVDVTGDRPTPVAAQREAGRTSFKVHLYPGQLAVFHLRP